MTGFLLSSVLLWGQAYIPYKTITGEGERALLMQAAPDTSGHLLFGGGFDGTLLLGGREITDTAGMSIFTGKTDSTGQVSSLKVVASCVGLCDLQQLLVFPGGDAILFISFRKDLSAGDTVYSSHGLPAMVMVTLNAAGQVTGSRLLMRKFIGRVRTVVQDSSQNIWMGGWFRKMEVAGTVYRARGRKDAFLLWVDARDKVHAYITGGAGEQEVAFLWPADSDTLLVAGTFTQEMATGKILLRCDEGRSLFLAGCDSTGMRHPVTLGRAGDLRLSGGLLRPDSSLLLGGSFSGTFVTEDTSLVSAGYEDGFLLSPGEDRGMFVTLGGGQADRVEALAVDRRGRTFLAGSCGGTVVLGGDTVSASGREPALFLAETAQDGTILWARQPGAEEERTLSFLTVTADLLLWTGGNRQGCSPWLASYLDPCTLLHFDLPDEQYLCPGETDTLQAGAGYAAYLWTPGDITTPELEVSDTGYYKVQITDKYGCMAQDSIHVAGDSVRVLLTVQDEVLPEGFNGAVDLTVTSGLPPFGFLWNTGDESEDLTDLQAGTYTVQVTDSAGCSITAEAEVKARDVTGIYDLYNYPNPFADVTRILYTLPEGTDVEISIWDVSGKKLFVLEEKSGEKGVHSFEWARKNLKDGVYYLKMRSSLGEITKKIMIISR